MPSPPQNSHKNPQVCLSWIPPGNGWSWSGTWCAQAFPIVVRGSRSPGIAQQPEGPVSIALALESEPFEASCIIGHHSTCLQQ